MNTLRRRFTWVVVLVGLALLLAPYSAPALAQEPPPFTFTAPPANATFLPGQTVTIAWTGGDPNWAVNLQLVDIAAYTVATGVASGITNGGSYNWTIPSSLPFEGPCGRSYLFYIENTPRTSIAYGPEFTVVCQTSVAIDVKPGSFPNSINPKSKGKIPVGILSSSTFDAPAQIDQGSLTFGQTGDEPSLAFCNPSLEDVNGDGLPDLVCHFTTQLTEFRPGDTVGVLKGNSVAGIPITGTDSVRIVP